VPLSQRSATIGSTRMVRRAGKKEAVKAETDSSSARPGKLAHPWGGLQEQRGEEWRQQKRPSLRIATKGAPGPSSPGTNKRPN